MDQGHVLVVEDEVNALTALAEVLRDQGYRVDTALDGVEALARFEESEPDIVLTDLRMPRMSGLELLSELRARNDEAVVVVMTAFGAVETAVAALKEGAADYLMKPVNISELALVLERQMERRRLRREARQAQLRMEAAHRDLDAFAGRLGHDLLTPLAPIPLLAATLKNHSDPNVVNKADRITRNAHRLGDMLKELLTFSRLGREEPHGVTVGGRVIGESLEDLSPRIAEGQVTVETDLDATAAVDCGPGLFRQIVDNLVGNALKHLEGRPRRWVRVRLRGGGGFVELDVEDSGPGIPPESLERIFDLFYRVPDNPVAGSGIGLATVRRIVDANDGQVTVRSVVGQGTAFRVRLPAAKEHRPPEAVAAPGSPV